MESDFKSRKNKKNSVKFSDNKVRFWRTRMNNNNEKYLFEWEEWKMESADGISSIEVPGRPVSVSAAFTGKY